MAGRRKTQVKYTVDAITYAVVSAFRLRLYPKNIVMVSLRAAEGGEAIPLPE